MFFIVSKILSFLLTPISWIIVLFVISIIVHSKSTKKKIRTFCIILLVLFSNPFLHKQTVLWWQAKPVTLAPNNHYSAGILLGGIIFFDKNNVGYFDNAADRFIQAEKLYHQGFIEKIIATGGSSAIFHKEPKEADFLQHELLASGVAEKDILIDNTARNTFENAVNTKKIIYESYNLSSSQPTGTYEIDHLIPLALGGNNDNSNLWPESAKPNPGFKEKDIVEVYLYEEVCANRIALSTAQDEIAKDWTLVYKKLSPFKIFELENKYKSWAN